MKFKKFVKNDILQMSFIIYNIIADVIQNICNKKEKIWWLYLTNFYKKLRTVGLLNGQNIFEASSKKTYEELEGKTG